MNRRTEWQRTGGNTGRFVVTEDVEVPLEYAVWHGWAPMPQPATACAGLGWLFGGLFTLALVLAGCGYQGDFKHPEVCREYKDAANHQHLDLVNDGNWCSFFWGHIYGDGLRAMPDGRAVSEPAHGTLRVRSEPNKTWYDYKPEPGYTGPDAFTIQPGPLGNPQYPIEVQVRAAP